MCQTSLTMTPFLSYNVTALMRFLPLYLLRVLGSSGSRRGISISSPIDFPLRQVNPLPPGPLQQMRSSRSPAPQIWETISVVCFLVGVGPSKKGTTEVPVLSFPQAQTGGRWLSSPMHGFSTRETNQESMNLQCSIASRSRSKTSRTTRCSLSLSTAVGKGT